MPASTENFKGHYRKAVKTAIYRSGGRVAPPWKYATLNELLDELAVYSDDNYMRARYPKLEVDPRASNAVKLKAPPARFPEERYNVQVDCWLWYVAQEADDNDFHLIIGSSSRTGARLMTAEVSGLPLSGVNRTPLEKPRQQIRDLVTGITRGYKLVQPKPKVRVTGSLFYDGCHPVGANGPKGFEPATSWEIHPVISIDKL